jgi:hypothetical protein
MSYDQTDIQKMRNWTKSRESLVLDAGIAIRMQPLAEVLALHRELSAVYQKWIKSS